MNKDQNNVEKTDAPEGENKNNFTLLYVAIGCFAAACILFVMAIVFPLLNVNGASVYMLIASLISSLAAVSFLNGQKRRVYNKLCKIICILSYAVMIAGLAVFVIGASVGSSAKQ